MNGLAGASRDLMPAYWLFPTSDIVTYKYYLGRLKMFEDKYDEARY